MDKLGLRACFINTRGSAARDIGRRRGGEARESPQRALSAEPTKPAGKRPAARPVRRSFSGGGRVFAQKALWLRCSSVEDPPGIFSFVAPRHRAFCAKTEPLVFLKHALSGAVKFVRVLLVVS